VTDYRLIADPRADLDVEAAFEWYENEQPGVGFELLDELRAAYNSVANGPFKYQVLRSQIRRALLRRFPFAVYFVIDGHVIVVLAVLHASRDPAEWQLRRD
jgi:toxin ParE1/3/4